MEDQKRTPLGRKRQLEKEINTLMADYEMETGLMITGATFHREQRLSGRPDKDPTMEFAVAVL